MAFNQNQKERLAEIYREMETLLHEALQLVRTNGNKQDLDNAKRMWAGYISTGLNGNEGFSFVTIDKNNFLAFLQDLGYDEETDSFFDDGEKEDEDEEVEPEEN